MIKLNGKEVISGNFPNRETYISFDKLNFKVYNRVEWEYEDDSEFFKLGLLKNHIDNSLMKAEIIIYYFPHSRMDRKNGSYLFSLKYAADLINSMNFVAVTIYEPHSDVTPALLDRSYPINWCMANLKEAVIQSQANSLFFPDAGAAKRYAGINPLPYGIGNKIRDFNTGSIISYSIDGSVGENVLIVDDLCSRGGTFIYAAKELRARGAKKVSLLVAHCEENVLTGNLFNYIDKLYTGPFNKAEYKQIIKL